MARFDLVLSEQLKKKVRRWAAKLELTMGAFVRQAVIEKIKALKEDK